MFWAVGSPVPYVQNILSCGEPCNWLRYWLVDLLFLATYWLPGGVVVIIYWVVQKVVAVENFPLRKEKW